MIGWVCAHFIRHFMPFSTNLLTSDALCRCVPGTDNKVFEVDCLSTFSYHPVSSASASARNDVASSSASSKPTVASHPVGGSGALTGRSGRSRLFFWLQHTYSDGPGPRGEYGSTGLGILFRLRSIIMMLSSSLAWFWHASGFQYVFSRVFVSRERF